MGEKKSRAESYDPDEEYATAGPLTRIFDNARARILDQATLVGKMEQTISLLVESTNLSYKTVRNCVEQLIGIGLMEESRKMGNAKTYVFRVENHLSGLIAWAQQQEIDRIKEEAGIE